MKDEDKSKGQLIDELRELRRQTAAWEQTKVEHKSRQEQFTGLIKGLLSLGVDPLENITRLTAMCGELLHGTCALYNRLEQGMLCSVGHWNVPSDYNPLDAPDGHICFDLISKGLDETMVVRGLTRTPYAKTDPNVMKYKLQTYMGHPVKSGEAYIGSLCVVYEEDVDPSENDRLLIRAIASAISLEEQRKQAEDALSGQLEFLQTLMEAIPDPVFYKDVDGKYLGCNAAFADLIRSTREDVVGKTVHEIVPENLSRISWQKDKELFDDPQVQVVEFAAQDRTGAPRFMSVHKAPFCKPDGKLAGLIGVVVEITDRKMREIELSANLTFVQTLMDAIPNPVYYKDKKGTYLGCNRAFTEWVGLPKDKIIGRKVHDIARKDFADVYEKQDMELLTHPGRKVYEFSSLHPDGTLRSTISNKSTFANAEGAVGGVIGVISDVSSLKRAQEALKLERQQLLSIFDSIDEVISVADAESYEVLFTNKFMKNLYGKELIGRVCFKELHGLDSPCSYCHMVMAKSLHGEPCRWEYHNPTSNRDYLATDRIIRWTEGRDAKFHLGIDITERKRAEEALRESEEFSRRLVEHAPFGIAYLASDGTVEYVNSAADIMAGIPEGEISAVLGVNVFDLPGIRDQPAVQEGLRRVLKGASVSDFEVPYKASMGRDTVLLAGATPRFGKDGTVAGAILMFTDISERKRAEELQRETARFRAVADLAGGVAHNFNNLLQIVIGYLELAILDLESGNYPAVLDALETVLESSRFGAETVRRLQSFAGIRDHTEPSEQGVFDLSGIVRQTLEMSKTWWKTIPEKKGIVISVDSELQDECLVRADKNQLFEVVVNLIRNATEALPQGGTIDVETRVEGSRVVLKVRDAGIGISQENLGRLFNPFFTTKAKVGSGLGLASSRKIIEDFEGEILVESSEGRGTTFTIRLPLAEQPSEQTEPVPVSVPHMTVLVIDDMEAVLEVLKAGLTRSGHLVVTASSGQEGLQIFKENPIDLVICDLGMPGINGWEVGKRIRAICEERHISKTPFILLTGWGGQQTEAEKIAESGVDAVVEKPLNIGYILEIVREIGKRETSQVPQ